MQRDYMLIAHPSAADGMDFQADFKRAIDKVRALHPHIRWHAEFLLGPRDCVEVFTAPDSTAASEVSTMVGFAGIRAEVRPLRSRW